jgi:hypothetical protein
MLAGSKSLVLFFIDRWSVLLLPTFKLISLNIQAIKAILALGKQVAGFVELHVKPSVSDHASWKN